MRDEDLRTYLATVEGDAPSPEFLASLFTEVEAERGRARGGDAVLAAYTAGPVDHAWTSVSSSEDRRPGRARRWGTALAAAAILVVVGLVVVDTGRDGTQVATTRLPHGFSSSVLPTAIIRGGDGDLVIPTDPSTGLDPILPPWYRQERSTIVDLGFVAGISVTFDLAVPDERQDCTDPDLRHAVRNQSSVHYVPCGASSAALLFTDDVGAVNALDVLVDHLAANSPGIYQLGVVLEPVRELEAQLGDEAEAYVLEQFVDSRAAVQVVVVAWRTDNLVQFVWDIQGRGFADGVTALLDVAESIERRTVADQQTGED